MKCISAQTMIMANKIMREGIEFERWKVIEIIIKIEKSTYTGAK